ncbi:MAG: SLC13 family permease [Cellvibrionales bacterium]|nr:SLC13 family permease [Cellvibrionales bacterium]
MHKTIALFSGLILALASCLTLHFLGFDFHLSVTVFVAVLCVIWWLFEPVPIPITSLIPLAVFQLTGTLDKHVIGASYGSPLILLLLGGFILSKAMESSGAHKRLAVFMIRLFGKHSSRGLLLGFMASTALLSMWISNTATTLMMLPVALAILAEKNDLKLAIPLMLGIAWSASIGGLGTPIGTPANLVFMQVYNDNAGAELGFSDWMHFGIPTVLFMIIIAWAWLGRSLTYNGGFQLPDMGKWSAYEKRVIWVFAITAFLWITRTEPFGGWRGLLNIPANDASVALLSVVAMFMIPNGQGEKLLNWEKAQQIPWGVLLLFGGGICLAKAFSASGLSDHLAHALSGITVLPTVIAVCLIALFVTFLTETTSNTATTVLLMPVLAATALSADMNPEVLMVPAVLSASCAFMMPVATAPNSIVMGSGLVKTRDMARNGVVLNLLGTAVITMVVWLVVL